jgi:DNA-binding response OmpR family regulator
MALAQPSSETSNSRVLIVDDEQVARFILGKWLRIWNVQATFCSDASSALKEFKSREYSLAIVDYYLPDNNGIELIKQMRECIGPQPTFALHSTDLELHHLARQSDVTYFLPKPFSNGALYNILRESSCYPKAYDKESAEPKVDELPVYPRFTV